ncbi:MAG: hypothetical protein ACOY0S_02255 [Patescibacteria group bacterium]
MNISLDLPEGSDLSLFEGKWYAPWGVLPALILLPLQPQTTGYSVDPIFLSLLSASLNVGFIFLFLHRLKREFFPRLTSWEIYLLLILFTFGTAHFLVGIKDGVWFIDQMVSTTLGVVGLYVIFKKNRTPRDYLLSSILFSLAFLGRATISLLIVIPVFLYLDDFILHRNNILVAFRQHLAKIITLFVLPWLGFVFILLLYNYLRFKNPFEFGYSYIQDNLYLAQFRLASGPFSLRHLPRNLWYMLLEIPCLSLDSNYKISLDYNPNGNSIFFLTPPFLAIFLAKPFLKVRRRWRLDPYIAALWLAVVITIIPSLLFYSSGWWQLGYRFSLDIVPVLWLLSILGIKGRLNFLYVLGILFSVVVHFIGVNSWIR